jgi:hypothetical protein
VTRLAVARLDAMPILTDKGVMKALSINPIIICCGIICR